MIDGPCRTCTSRWVNTTNMTRCHSTCEAYAAYKTKLNDLKKDHIKEINADAVFAPAYDFRHSWQIRRKERRNRKML